MTEFEVRAREFIASRASKNTQTAYSHDLGLWLGHCAETGTDPAEPSLSAVVAFRDALQQKFEPLTVRRVLSSLSKMYRSARAGASPAVSWNPFDPESLPRPAPTSFARTESVSDDVVQRLIAGAEEVGNVRDAAVVRLLYSTGLRRFSIVRMRRADVFRRGTVTIARVVVKGAKQAEVELTEDAVESLNRWLEVAPSSEWIFPNMRSPERHIGESVVNKVVTLCAARAELQHVRPHPHMFRAAYVTSALNAGVALHDIQAAVHHADPKTTLRYDRGVRGVGVAAAVAKHRGTK